MRGWGDCCNRCVEDIKWENITWLLHLPSLLHTAHLWFYHTLSFSCAPIKTVLQHRYYQRCWMPSFPTEGNYSIAGNCEWSSQPASCLLLYLLPEEQVPNGSPGSPFLQQRMRWDQSAGWAPEPPDSPPSVSAGGIKVGCQSFTSLRAPSLPPPSSSSSLLLPLCNTNPVIFHSAGQTAVCGGKWGGK